MSGSYRITFPLGAFGLDREVEDTSALRSQCLYECLKALTAVDLHILRYHAARGRPIPPLYQSGVFYQPEPEGQEDWNDILTCLSELRQGRGSDCEDLACWLSAEYQFRGIPAHPIFVWRRMPDGGTLYHIQVMLPDGRIEDPSKRLGMR